MVSQNSNTWEVENRGLLYKFNTSTTALKMGMKSISMCFESGIQLSEMEVEAISNLDRDEDKQTRYYSSPLSVILRQAVELTDLLGRK